MKISELSQTTSVPVPTIKFYIREGLLPVGERTARNQADYGIEHVERLALIRSLREAAGLPVETIAKVLRAADSATEDFVVAAIDALERPAQANVEVPAATLREAAEFLLRLARRRGWKIEPTDQSLHDAARALAVIRISCMTDGLDDQEAAHEVYADAVDRIAALEIPESWAPDDSPDAALRYALLGTVLFEPFILALRRMAHVARSRKLSNKPASAQAPEKRRGKR